MSKICEKCGKHPVAGRSYARRGLAKKKGGVGRKITGVTKRRFTPNIQIVRIRDENGTVRRARLCAKCLKTGLRKGTITKAPRKPRARKAAAAEPVPVVSPPLEFRETGPEAPRPAPGEITERLAEEIDAAYDEEKGAEAQDRSPFVEDAGAPSLAAPSGPSEDPTFRAEAADGEALRGSSEEGPPSDEPAGDVTESETPPDDQPPE